MSLVLELTADIGKLMVDVRIESREVQYVDR